MEYYLDIKRNTFESVLMRWMNLEPIIQSEVSQKEKDKYCILTHIFSPEYSLEGLMLELKLQYFGHLMRRAESWEKPWCWEGLGSGGEGDDREWDGWMASPTQWTWVWASSVSWWRTGRPGVLQSVGCKESDTTERLNWTELNIYTMEYYTAIKRNEAESFAGFYLH